MSLSTALQDAIESAVKIKAVDRAALLAALDSAPTPCSQRHLAAHVSAEAGVKKPVVWSVLGMTWSIIQTARPTGADVVREVSEEARRTDLLVDTDAKGFADFLRQLMERKDILRSASQITRLLHDHENLYNDAEVITDFRPFWGDGTSGITAGTICHTLRLNVLGAREEPLAFYVALDAADLVALRAKVDHAINKGKTLKQTLEGLQIPISDE